MWLRFSWFLASYQWSAVLGHNSYFYTVKWIKSSYYYSWVSSHEKLVLMDVTASKNVHNLRVQFLTQFKIWIILEVKGIGSFLLSYQEIMNSFTRAMTILKIGHSVTVVFDIECSTLSVNTWISGWVNCLLAWFGINRAFK